jgi:phosphatidylglycerophosphate synthase
MGEGEYQVTDRRPIKARDLPFFQKLAANLAAKGASANAISVAGAACSILAGAALALTRITPNPWARALWVCGAIGAQLRLQANLLDGMVAIAGGKASAVGELYNEVPDRISDPAIFIGLGYAAGAQPWLGWLAALLAVLTAYVRVLGKSAGAGSDFCGPMGKQHRMAVVTVLCVVCALLPVQWLAWEPANVALAIVCLGSFITAWRRLNHIAGKLKAKT